ncbi:glycosyltransferase family 39 protein [Dyadobacter sp. CY345]|uniref:ArnT family glycosyltransferase n=1 Tax=Dyadobacter sp. CY345 TaxID=2909335 RepID=UPI001F2B482A|nr:glycosyltransferase family 39 protein [Dyadobacter sp. CY345]MCF2443520.1 glycosyltransferase family 39 protein [Dyadobacter sp. CY345]
MLYVVPLVLLIAIVPPNNFDAHSYHLSRIIEWLGNGNVDHFPTRHIQQLYHNIFGEYLVMHTFLLAGSDGFAGFVQFFASIGSIFGVSLLAKKLGASTRAQTLCAILLLTLPIGILESTTVQVDYVACFFFISFIYFGHDAIEFPRAETLVAMALSLAFGAFSKYTILMYALPFSIYFGITFFRKLGFTQTIKILGLFTLILTLVFLPFMSRNYQFFGNVLSPVEGYGLEVEKLSVEDFSLLATISGIIKNLSLHLGLPFNNYNVYLEKLITTAHGIIGFNVNDQRYGMDIFTVRFDVHEDMVPNNIHFIILTTSFIALFFASRATRLKWLAFCAFIGFVIFCTMMVFQLWSTRTHMPFFAMGCVVSGILFERLLKSNTVYLSVFLIIASLGYVMGNPSKPLLPLKYYSKKFLNYIPVAICPENEQQEQGVKLRLGSFYETNANESNCFVLKTNPKENDRQAIFKTLDSLGYYNDEKYETVFELSKEKMYFLSHPGDYENFKEIIPILENVKGNVGILFEKGNGFYHYWAVAQPAKANFGQMKYIGYRPRYAQLENAKKEFNYSYVLGDNPKLLSSCYAKRLIDTVYHSKSFYLAKLKVASGDKFFISN